MKSFKKVLSLILAIIIMLPSSMVISDAKITTITGDINCDGEVSAADARLTLRFSANLDEPTDEQKDAADVNNDGDITASDARKILRVSAGLEEFDNTTNNNSQLKNVLVMATSADFAPFEYIENDIYKGIDIEIAEILADKLNMTLEIKDVAFETIIKGVECGTYDIGISAICITDEKLESVDFSIEYYTNIQYIEDFGYIEDHYAIAVSKNNQELLNSINEVLKEMKSDGTIEEIAKKYIQ